MILFDACAVIAVMTDEPAAGKVAELLRESGMLTSVGVSEVLDHLVRRIGVEEHEAILDLGLLELQEPVLIEEFVGVRAGALRAAHYHRTARPVSIADCIAAEAARWNDAPLATSDPHLLDLCHDEGIPAIPLPDSTGAVWSPTR